VSASIEQPDKDTSLLAAPSSTERLWLALTWALFLGLGLVTLVVFFGSLPSYSALLQTICVEGRCIVGQPTRETALALESFGLSVKIYARTAIVLNSATELFACVLGLWLVWRRPNDRLALLVALMLIMTCATPSMYSLLQHPSAWQAPALIVNLLAFGMLFFVAPQLPDGRFVPGWARWLSIGWLVWNVVALGIFKQSYPGAITNTFWFVALIALAVALITRYRGMSDPVARQQLKWVVFGWSAVLALSVIVNLPEVIKPLGGQPGSLYDVVRLLINSTLIAPSMLAIWFAISRYRLWDIDILVNRTLVYGTLTFTLALLYLGSVLILQSVFTPIAGSSDIAIVGSTLAIASLFTPLRHSIQSAIDRRFYRHKYDAAKTLARFNERIRNEVELSRLIAELLEVVEETVRPEHVTLWLREPRSNRRPAVAAEARRTPASAEDSRGD
jgi:hypothetical protein